MISKILYHKQYTVHKSNLVFINFILIIFHFTIYSSWHPHRQKSDGSADLSLISRSGRLVQSRISNTLESVNRMPSLGNAISCAISNINIQRSAGWRGGGVVRAFLLKIQSVPREINMAMLQPTTTFVLIIKSVATCYDAHTRLYISTRSVKITRLVELAVIMDTCRFVSSFFHSGANLLSLEKM